MSKLSQEEKRKIGVIVELLEYCTETLEEYKPMFREMTEEEIKEINKGTFFEISRKNNTKTTFPAEYKAEEKAFKETLKEKYKDTITTEKRENYSIEYHSTSYSRAKAEIIINNMLTSTKKELNTMSASKNKNIK